MTELVVSEYHGHPIVPWAVEQVCYFCQYPASQKVTEDYVPPPPQGFSGHPYTAYVCCNHFFGSCKNGDAPRCRKCRHPWYEHEKEIKLTDRTLYECLVHIGMGNWCGCKERKPK